MEVKGSERRTEMMREQQDASKRAATAQYILFKKFKIYIKTLKTLLHVSILRSSSGSTYCSLLMLYIKTISDLLCYISFGDVAACLEVENMFY